MKENENITKKIIDSEKGLRLKEFYEQQNYTQESFAEKIGASQPYISAVVSGKRNIGSNILNRIKDAFPNFNEYWFTTGETEEELRKRLGGKNIDQNFSASDAHSKKKDEVLPKKYEGLTPVKIVTTKARGGWSDMHYSTEYLENMPTVLIESDQNYHGEYLAFEVDGDSMEPEYFPGDIVICRNLSRDKWRYKLHYKDYDFVIAHGTMGVMIKEIIDHDIETGIITCRSLNNEDGKHADFTIKLGEVAFLYNVVEVRQKGKNKKQRR